MRRRKVKQQLRRPVQMVLLSLLFAGVIKPSHALASGDFPLASCKGWNGTMNSISGVNTARATMKGSVTSADLGEYCERDPGGETVQYGGKLTVEQCIATHKKEVRRIELKTVANCSTGQLTFDYGSQTRSKVKFPVSAQTDQSCASGLPPLREQFKMLCPESASTHEVSVKIVGVFLDGRIRKVDVSYVVDLVRSTARGVIVNCNSSSPQVEIDGTNSEVDLRKNEDYSLGGRPLKSIWIKSCE